MENIVRNVQYYDRFAPKPGPLFNKMKQTRNMRQVAYQEKALPQMLMQFKAIRH